MIEEVGSSRQRNELEVQTPQSVIVQEASPWAQAGVCLFMDLFSQWGGVRFFLRCCAFLMPFGPPRDFCLVGGPGCWEAAASVGATVAL